MRWMRVTGVFLWGLLSGLAEAQDEEREVREAVSALARTSYAWSTTARERFKGETKEARGAGKAAIEVEGKFEADGLMQLTAPASREMPVALTALFSGGDAVARTPNGWLRRSELRQAAGADRAVTFEGKSVGLSRVMSAALKLTARKPATEELFDLLVEVKSWRRVEGVILAELRDQAVERAWGDAQAKRAPEIHGTVLFKIGEQGLAEYHVVLGIGFPNSRTKAVAWSMQQWSTRFTGIGTTRVEVPPEAIAVLEK